MTGDWMDETSVRLLRWAWGKTGSREQAEDLAQEVWLQYLSAVRRQEQRGCPVEQPEHLMWRVAHFVWCSTLRQMTAHRTVPLDEALPSPHDLAGEHALQAEQAQQMAWLRQRIVNLNRLQREAMILHYVEQLPQKEVARRLGLSEATLRWHLFDTRKKLREGVSDMNDTTGFVYTPRRLSIGINGRAVPNLATQRVTGDLLMQNLCCACYHEGRTPQELAEMLGVARPYIEHDLAWLTEQELLRERGGRYYTDFLIKTSRQEAQLFQVFEQHKPTLCDAITGGLLAKERTIREIGFIGCDRPMAKLLWLLIFLFTRRLPMPDESPEPPIRPDGGKYWPLGFDRTEPLPEPLCSFDYNGSMNNDGFYWFGLHNFGQSEIEDMMDAWTPEYRALRALLERLIHAGFDPACVMEGEQFILAQLIEKGFVIKEGASLRPSFVIFTGAQYDRLYREVLRPLADELQPEVHRLADNLRSVAAAMLPAHLSHLVPLAQSQAQLDVGYMTEFLAFHDGTLYHPVSKRDGEFLTMAYIDRA